MVEGGRTPLHSAKELQEMGYAAVIYANTAMRVAGKAMRHAFEVLRREGSTDSLIGAMLTWEERQSLAGLPMWRELEQTVTGARLAS